MSCGVDDGEKLRVMPAERRIERRDLEKRAFFDGPLPFGLTRADSPETAIAKVGPPSHQPERACVAYERRGLTLSFDRQRDKLESIWLRAARSR
jgi:hypothetical protein